MMKILKFPRRTPPLSTSVDEDMTYSVWHCLIIIHVRAESAILTVMFWLAAEQMDSFSPVWIFANNWKGVKLILKETQT